MSAAKKRGFRSKAQVGWAFANGKSFARKWAHRGIAASGRKKWKRQLPKHVAKKGKRAKR